MKLVLIALLVSCVCATFQNVPNFESFDYSGNYKIKGLGYNRNTFSPNVTASNNLTLYVNSDNSRILWDNGEPSKFMALTNGSYFWGNLIRNDTGHLVCLYRPDYGYARTLVEYGKSFGTKEIGAISSYFGSVFDFGSCGAKLNHRTDVLKLFGNNVILRQEFAQQLYVKFLGICIDLYGTVEMDPLSLRFPGTTEFNTAFQLPPICWSNTLDYCSFAYPGDLCH